MPNWMLFAAIVLAAVFVAARWIGRRSASPSTGRVLAFGVLILATTSTFLLYGGQRLHAQNESDHKLAISANGREYVVLSSRQTRSIDIEVIDVLGRSLGLEVLVDGASIAKSATESGKLEYHVPPTHGIVTVVAIDPSQTDPRDVRVRVTEHFSDA